MAVDKHHHHGDDDDGDNDNDNDDNFDQAHKGCSKAATQGWEGELKQYIEEPLCDMKKKDTLKWWLVSEIFMSSMVRALISRIYDRCIP